MNASGSSILSCDPAQTDEQPRERSYRRHGRRDAPGYKTPQNTSPPFAHSHQASKWRTFTPRRSEHPTASVVQFRSVFYTCVVHFNTVPVLCKLVMKSSANDTVKGFDGVHVLPLADSFEIWLGESKFYEDPKSAIREAVRSVQDHLLPAFITAEKAMIFGHIGKDVPYREAVVRLFKSQTSGDELLKLAVFPILIAYDSGTAREHRELCDDYTRQLEEEVRVSKQVFFRQSRWLDGSFPG